MFDNIGEKIKKLAAIVTWLGIIASILSAIAIWVNESEYLLGLIVLVCGYLGSWIGSFLLYGFGELISRMQSIDEKLNYGTSPKVKPINPSAVKEYEVEPTEEDYEEYPEGEYFEEDCAEENEAYLDEDDIDFDERNIPKENECPYCFTEISPSDIKCPYCGNRLK